MSRGFFLALLFAGVTTCSTAYSQAEPAGQACCVVAAYYFPGWHVDPKNEVRRKGPWTEWEVIKAAKPRFPGHTQPKVPLWGYQMDNVPEVMAQKIDAAASNGINAFIFDWYYHESGQYLSSALDDGFLKAPNRDRMKFALMWANHRLRGESGEVSMATFEKIMHKLVYEYFTNPAYLKIDEKPYFSIYEIGTFITGVGGIQNARNSIRALRKLAINAGLNGVHVNVVDWQLRNRTYAAKLLKTLDIDSVTTYTWTHIVPLKNLGFPSVDYMEVAGRYFNYASEAEKRYGVPYFFNATMGWDPTPRMRPNKPFDGRGRPNTPVIVGNTPDRFRQVLLQTKEKVCLSRSSDQLIIINAWNEWGEGSYLEPDTITKMEYLSAIRDVFVSEQPNLSVADSGKRNN